MIDNYIFFFLSNNDGTSFFVMADFKTPSNIISSRIVINSFFYLFRIISDLLRAMNRRIIA